MVSVVLRGDWRLGALLSARGPQMDDHDSLAKSVATAILETPTTFTGVVGRHGSSDRHCF